MAASSAAAYPGTPACRVRPLDYPERVPTLQPGIQIEDVGGIRIVQAGFPPLAHRAVTGDQLRVGMTHPVRHALRTEVQRL